MFYKDREFFAVILDRLQDQNATGQNNGRKSHQVLNCWMPKNHSMICVGPWQLREFCGSVIPLCQLVALSPMEDSTYSIEGPQSPGLCFLMLSSSSFLLWFPRICIVITEATEPPFCNFTGCHTGSAPVAADSLLHWALTGTPAMFVGCTSQIY